MEQKPHGAGDVSLIGRACCRCSRDDQPWDRIAGKAYCAACEELLALGEAPPLLERVEPNRCVVCERVGTIRFETYPLERTVPVIVDLCGEHVRALLSRSLGPFAFHQLSRHFRAQGVGRVEVFLLHDAFYDYNGRALQPVIS
ncbi:MAG TPA: hypothetical protein VFA18_06025 [Gemmataceae bacterium]|nr:hypothetical protein [Gemmataceae bacterium]